MEKPAGSGGMRPVRSISTPPTDINARRNTFLTAYTVEAGDLLDQTADIEFLVPGAIPCGNVVLFSGESGGGKTWTVYDLARATATGTKWLQRGVPVKQGPVIIFNYDNPTQTLAARFIRLGFQKGWPVRVHTQGWTKPPQPGMPEILTLPTNRKYLRMIIEAFKPALIVVDSFRQLHELDENDSKDMKIVMSILKEWTNIGGATVALIHHTSKSGGGKWEASARGSGEIISSAGVVVEVRKAETKNLSGAAGTLHWSKHQAWPIGQTKECTFEVVDEDDREGSFTLVKATSALPGEIDRANEEKILGVLAAAGKPMTREEVYVLTKGLAKSVVNRSLNKLLGRKKLVYRHKPARTYAIA